MWAASLLVAAVAPAEGRWALEAVCPAAPQPMRLGDSVSLVHTSLEIALEVESGWTESQFSLARARDRSLASEEVAAPRSPEAVECPDLSGEYEEPVYEGESPVWELTMQIPMEPKGPEAPCGKFVVECMTLNEQFRGFIFPRTNASNSHLYVAKFENDEVVGTKPFDALVLANGNIMIGSTEFKKRDTSGARRVARSGVPLVQQRLLRRAARDGAKAGQTSSMDTSATQKEAQQENTPFCMPDPRFLGRSCEEQGTQSITDEATCQAAYTQVVEPVVGGYEHPVEYLGSVNASANLRGCNCWLTCRRVASTQGAGGGAPPGDTGGLPAGGLPTVPAGGLPTVPGGGLSPTPAGGLSPAPAGGLPAGGLPAGGLPTVPTGGLPTVPGGGLSPTPAGGLSPTPAGGLPAGGLPTVPTGGLSPAPAGDLPAPPLGGPPSSPFGRAAAREAGCPPGKICVLPDSGPMPTDQGGSDEAETSLGSKLECKHFCAFNTARNGQADVTDWQLAVCTGCGVDIPDFPGDDKAPMEDLRDLSPSPGPDPRDVPRPCVCVTLWDPVCGADGKRYGNACEAGCADVVVNCKGECPCEDPSASGDPHVNNVAGEYFDVNQPEDYVLLRVPLEPSRPPLLELRGQIKADDLNDACAMYIREMTLRGEWLGSSIVEVRPLRRDKPGSNSAGNTTTWPFSFRQTDSSTMHSWRSVADFGKSGNDLEVLSDFVSVAAREKPEDSRSSPEGQSFDFVVGSDSKSRANIIVSQGPRQSLSVKMKSLRSLGEQRIGGLLGTEPHDRKLEEPTQECKTSRASSVRSDARGGGSASLLSASW